MKISIITVVRNNEKTIEDAILSVLSQTYPHIEHIIVDGNSSDSTVEIINNYKDRLGGFISEEDNGLYDAMNKGIKSATGEVIGILNSDDLYHGESTIESVMAEFITKPELDIIYGDLVYVKSENVEQLVRTWKSKAYYSDFFEHANVPPHPSLFVRRKVYELEGFFNLDYKLAADYDFMLRIFKRHNFNSLHMNTVFVKMRMGGATNTSLSNIIKQNKEILRSWRNNDYNAPFYFMPLRLIKRIKQFF
jgi:glycosyltransferase involved in cell wall biosynthesis